jgi:hypothetical protein
MSQRREKNFFSVNLSDSATVAGNTPRPPRVVALQKAFFNLAIDATEPLFGRLFPEKP